MEQDEYGILPFEVGFMVKLQVIELGFRTNPN